MTVGVRSERRSRRPPPDAVRWLQALPGLPAEVAANAQLAAEVDAFVAGAPRA